MFLVEKIMPKGALCSLVGESEVGKSQLSNQIGLAIASGKTQVFGLKIDAKHQKVLYVITEDSPHSLKRRFKKLSPEQEKPCNGIEFLFEAETNLHEDVRKYIEKKPVDLIVIDHWMDMFEGDGNNGAAVRKFLTPFSTIADESGTSILLLHHYRKSTSRKHDKMDVLGSQSFEAKMRSVIALEETSTDDFRRLKILKSNLLSDSEKKFALDLRINDNWQFELQDAAQIVSDNQPLDKYDVVEKIVIENNLLDLSSRKAAEVLQEQFKIKASKSLVAQVMKKHRLKKDISK